MAASPCPCGMLCYSYVWKTTCHGCLDNYLSTVANALAGIRYLLPVAASLLARLGRLRSVLVSLLQTCLQQLARSEALRLMTSHVRLCGVMIHLYRYTSRPKSSSEQTHAFELSKKEPASLY